MRFNRSSRNGWRAVYANSIRLRGQVAGLRLNRRQPVQTSICVSRTLRPLSVLLYHTGKTWR